MNSITAFINNRLASSLTPEEALQISVDITGDKLDNLSYSINGPEEIVSKATAALQED